MITSVRAYQDQYGNFYKTAKEALEAEQIVAIDKLVRDKDGYYSPRLVLANKEEVLKVLLRTV